MVLLQLDGGSSLDLQNQDYHYGLELLRRKLQYSGKKFSLSFRCIHIIGEGRQKVEFVQPSDVKVSDLLSLIFVSDTGANRIMVFDLKTKEFKYSLTGITSPLMISIDTVDQKNIYFSNLNNEVVKLDIESKKIQWNVSNGLRHPSGLVADNVTNGKIFVSNCSNNEIICLSKQNGNFISSFDACRYPFGLDLNVEGDLVVTSLFTHTISGISKVLEKKQVYFSFGKKGVGPHEFQYPRGIFVEKLSGYIYICDQSNSRVHVFDSLGNFIQSYGEIGLTKNSTSHFKFPTGLCISESRGELFVADTANKKIQVFR